MVQTTLMFDTIITIIIMSIIYGFCHKSLSGLSAGGKVGLHVFAIILLPFSPKLMACLSSLAPHHDLNFPSHHGHP